MTSRRQRISPGRPLLAPRRALGPSAGERRVATSLTRLAVEIEVLQRKLAHRGVRSADVDDLAVVVDDLR